MNTGIGYGNEAVRGRLEPDSYEALMLSSDAMGAQITTNLHTDLPSLQTNPADLEFLEFNRSKETIAEGYNETRVQIEPVFRKGGQFELF